MASVTEGKFAMVPIPDPKLGPRKVDVDAMFNKERYRPSYANKETLPLFLTHALT
jgi:6-phosphofructokinase 1